MAWPSRSRALSVAIAALAAGAGAARADADEIAEVDVVVVPFTSESESDADEAAALSRATADVYRQGGATVELAGVSAEEILTLSGCSATDDECLASLPDTLGAGTVVFGSLRVTASDRRVILVIVERGSPRRRESLALADNAVERDPRFRAELSRRLSGQDPAVELPPTSIEEPPAELPFVTEPASDRPTRARWDASAVSRGPWIAAAVGAGAMATGGLLLVLGERKQSQVDSAPTESVADLEHLESLEGQARALYTAGDVLLLGGLVTAAVGGALIFHQGYQREAQPATLTVTPFVLRGGGGLVLSFGASP